MLSLEERLERCEIDLALSYECLALEQEGAKRAERELSLSRRELAFARRQFSACRRDLRVSIRQSQAVGGRLAQAEESWRAIEQRCQELEFEKQLLGLELTRSQSRADSLEEQLYLSEERRFDEQEERERLGRRLVAAQERVRELEVMLCERSPVRLDLTLAHLLKNKVSTGSVASPARPGRAQVERWMATWSGS